MIASYLLFFFAGLGAFNGLAVAGFLFLRRPAEPVSRWLGLLLVMVSVRTGKSVLFYFWPDVSKLILQVGLTACFLIGPCLIGFVRAWALPGDRRTRHDLTVVAGLLAFSVVFGVAVPYADNVALWGKLAWGLSYFWFACLVVSVGLYLHTVKQPSVRGRTDGLTRGHTAVVIGGLAVIWLAYFSVGLTSYIVGALSFSMVLYLSGIAALIWRRQRVVAEPYQDRKITPDEARAALQSLETLMVDEELFRDAGLSLGKVARRLNMPSARLSQLLNDNNKTTFKQFLAQLRVDAAKRQLRRPGQVLMEQVAETSGFLSMSTFYSTFKKLEGTTPAAWRQAQSTYPNS